MRILRSSPTRSTANVLTRKISAVPITTCQEIDAHLLEVAGRKNSSWGFAIAFLLLAEALPGGSYVFNRLFRTLTI